MVSADLGMTFIRGACFLIGEKGVFGLTQWAEVEILHQFISLGRWDGTLLIGSCGPVGRLSFLSHRFCTDDDSGLL